MCTSGVSIDRRKFLKLSATASIGVGATSVMPSLVFGEESTRPHYFLQILIPAGVDASYLFDARPLSMTRDKLITNYLGEEPDVYVGVNGQSTLVTSIAKPLLKWSKYFSVINGIVMHSSFDGHDQNLNMLLTGNPFGGDSYLPWNNSQLLAMDYVQNQEGLFATLSNTGGSLALSPGQAKALGAKISGVTRSQAHIPAIAKRADAIGTSKGAMGAASRRFSQSLAGMSSLTQKFAAINLTQKPPETSDDPALKLSQRTKCDLEMLMQLMRLGITSTGVLTLNPYDEQTNSGIVDAHDGNSAKQLPNTLRRIIAALVSVFEDLAATPSQGGRTMLEDTTIMIASEFSRTMRQKHTEFENSGTDHNPLTNTVLLGGRGVRAELVIGASDFVSSDETLSAVHLLLDPDKIKIMGRPFDHNLGKSIENSSLKSFDSANYLTAIHVANTLQEILKMPRSKRFTFGRNLPAAPVVGVLVG